eukprot:gb/GECH01012572.1/.p1 GENE.gb/GECH01012572.1/~~gb/GECH01012572.1/.p1  ORF type:complete len:218 (+),score=47.37 gb/GECH01012572.1/:1-654(+)
MSQQQENPTTEQGQEQKQEQQTSGSPANNVDLSQTHRLHTPWTLWYDNPKKKTKSSYQKNLRKVYTCETVEDFWSVFNFIMQPSQLPLGSNYHLFRSGIHPSWEDPANDDGGAWNAPVGTRRDLNEDEVWLNAALACIGEHFDDGDSVCGIVLSVRSGDKDRLQLWTSRCEMPVAKRIGEQWRSALGFPDGFKVRYLRHNDAAQSRTVRKVQHTLEL